jgi:hypothetical protein
VRRTRDEREAARELSAASLVGARVDWLEVTFRVDFDPARLALLKRRGTEATKLDSPTCVGLGVHGFKLHAPSRSGRWLLQNDDARIEVLEHGPGRDKDTGSPGWGVRVIMSGTAMLAMGYRRAFGFAHEVARELGDVVEARNGRVDLCADLAGYELRPEDRNAFVKQRRVKLQPMAHDGAPVAVAKRKRRGTDGEEVSKAQAPMWKLDGRRVVALLKDADDGWNAEFYAGGTFTGFAFGSRTTVSARIYDKRHELRAGAVEEKRLAEEAEWKRNGWDGEACVTRVEFEFRGEALDELAMRHAVRGDASPDAHADLFAKSLDGAWAYATKKWLRLVRRGAPDVVQPRWRAVQAAVFVAAAAPRERIRKRGTAKAAQANGAMFSVLGARGELPEQLWLPYIDRRTGEVDADRWNADESALVAEVCARRLDGDEQAEAERIARAVLSEVGARTANVVWAYQLAKCGGDAKKGLARVWAKQRETQWRYASSASASGALSAVA